MRMILSGQCTGGNVPAEECEQSFPGRPCGCICHTPQEEPDEAEERNMVTVIVSGDETIYYAYLSTHPQFLNAFKMLLVATQTVLERSGGINEI